MKIEDVVREMRALADDIGRADIAGFGNRVNYLAGALERHLKDAQRPRAIGEQLPTLAACPHCQEPIEITPDGDVKASDFFSEDKT